MCYVNVKALNIIITLRELLKHQRQVMIVTHLAARETYV